MGGLVQGRAKQKSWEDLDPYEHKLTFHFLFVNLL